MHLQILILRPLAHVTFSQYVHFINPSINIWRKTLTAGCCNASYEKISPHTSSNVATGSSMNYSHVPYITSTQTTFCSYDDPKLLTIILNRIAG